eukprot:SAG31_NODE_3155_length_4612_cov_2.728784_4_plen_277_part_00
MLLEALLDVVLIAVMSAHLLAAPFTKVEESFTMQAMHDFLFFGTEIERYDHHEFPGVVPRSFLGAFCVAAIATPFHFAAQAFALPRFASQYIVRGVLGCASVGASGFLRRQLSAAFGRGVGVAFVAITAAQFHLPFYWSRSLPNTVALVLTTIATGYWIRGNAFAVEATFSDANQPRHLAAVRSLRTAVGLLTAATVVFRCDVLILLAVCCFQSLVAKPRVSMLQLLGTGLRWGLVALAATVFLDSILWGRVIWPEFEVFYFNTVENRSSEWGISP